MAEVNDITSERLVLAGLCQFGNEVYLDISDIITSDSFHNSINNIVYLCIQHVLSTSERVDLASLLASASELKLFDSLREKKELDYIKSLFGFESHKENVRAHAIKLRKLELIRKGQGLIHKTYNDLSQLTGVESVDKIVSTLESPIFEFVNTLNDSSEEGPTNLFENGEAYLDFLSENPIENIGIPSPFKNYNSIIGGGFRKGGVSLIGARAKQGKSSLGKEIALHVACKLGINVLILDTEMVKEDFFSKSIASLTNINIKDIETGQFGSNATKKNLVYNELKRVKNSPLDYVKVAGKDFEEILSIIRRWIHKKVGYDSNGKTKPALIIYDYFKLMSAETLKDMQEYQAIGFQISKLTDFSKQYDFSVLAFVQLNRDAFSREDSSTISGSDRLVWLAHSFAIFKDKSPEDIAEDGINLGNKKLIVSESRYGPGHNFGDYINMKFNKTTGKIEEGLSKSESQRQNNEF